MKQEDPYATITRWIARISGSLLVASTLFMGAGYYVKGVNEHAGSPLGSFTPLMVIVFIIWGIARTVLVLSLWKEGLGGFTSLTCFAAMSVLNLFNTQSPNRAGAVGVFAVLSIPSLLYIHYCGLPRTRPTHRTMENPA